MEEHLCARCGASLPPTGTYCLACDTPVEGAARGLSVGEIRVVKSGRPIVAVGVALAVLLLIGGIGYGVHDLVSTHEDGVVASAAKQDVGYIVEAEAGHPSACPVLAPLALGTAGTEKKACAAVVDDDPGAHLKRLHTVAVQRDGHRGSVELEGELVDAHGHRPFDRRFSMVEHDGSWLIDWNGAAIAAS